MENVEDLEDVEYLTSSDEDHLKKDHSKKDKKDEKDKKKIKKIKKDENLYLNLCCPITSMPFKEPMYLVDDGMTYEKSALETWLQKGSGKTPLGLPLIDCIYFPNKIMTEKSSVCPITKQKILDPVIVKEDGMTYEHDALIKLVEKTLCKFKLINLFTGPYSEIHVYQNKALWSGNSEHKPFKMPPKKKYKGIDKTHIKIIISNENAFPESLFIPNTKYINMLIEGSLIRTGCFKNILFKNCLFRDVIFRGTCFCSKLINCLFQSCVMINPIFKEGFMCPGTSFNNLTIVSGSDVDVENMLKTRGARKIKNLIQF